MSPEPDPNHPLTKRVFLRVEVGSTAHGTGLPDKEDYDEIGVMSTPWQEVVGLDHGQDTWTYRPGRAKTERSQPGDYDLVVHSARKFARLAADGNPSLLVALFGPVKYATLMGIELLEIREAFYSDRARQRFLGYAKAQRQRLLGERGGAHTNRPELIHMYGYDTKYAMHMVRLGFQGIEYMETGELKLPIPDYRGNMLRAIRQGEYTLQEVLGIAEQNEVHLKYSQFDAPPGPDTRQINQWLLNVFFSANNPI